MANRDVLLKSYQRKKKRPSSSTNEDRPSGKMTVSDDQSTMAPPSMNLSSLAEHSQAPQTHATI